MRCFLLGVPIAYSIEQKALSNVETVTCFIFGVYIDQLGTGCDESRVEGVVRRGKAGETKMIHCNSYGNF